MSAPALGAGGCSADPATAALNQYCESVPGTVGSPPRHHGRAHGGQIPRPTANALRGQRGGGAVLQKLQAVPQHGSGVASGGSTAGGASNGSAGIGGAQGPGGSGSTTSTVKKPVEPASHDVLAGLRSAGSSFFSYAAPGLVALLAAALVLAVAVSLRRRSTLGR